LWTVRFLEDVVCGLGPDEGVGSVVPAVDEGTDLGVQVLHGAEDAAPDGLAVDDSEPDLDEVQSGPGRGCEVHVDPGVRGEPVADLDPLVGGAVVHDQVQLDGLAVLVDVGGVGAGDLLEERQ
jgi:hypothetical protein